MWGGQRPLGWAGPKDAWWKALITEPQRVQGLQRERGGVGSGAHVGSVSQSLYERSLTLVSLGPSVDLGVPST